MELLRRKLLDAYELLVLRKPLIVWIVTIGVVALLAANLRDYRLEATQDSLVLRSDPDLNYYNESRRVWTSDEYVMLAVEHPDMFSDEGVNELKELRDALTEIEGVDHVQSILDVPLLMSPSPPLARRGARFSGPEVQDNLAKMITAIGTPMTLEDTECDRRAARGELTTHPVYGGNLIDADGRVTTMLVYIFQDPERLAIEIPRDILREEVRQYRVAGKPVPADLQQRLDVAEEAVRPLLNKYDLDKHHIVTEVRRVAGEHTARTGHMTYLSGLPVIVTCMVEYLQDDTVRFSIGAIAMLILLLGLVFRRVRWVALPLVTCAAIVASVTGAMILAGVRPTIITAYIVVLLFIIAMAHSIHTIVRFRELQVALADVTTRTRVRRTVAAIFVPCLYTALTTGVGFGSLVVCDIAPVIDFGQVMAAGVMAALLLSFVLLPAAMILFGEPKAPRSFKTRPTHNTQQDTEALLRSPDQIVAATGDKKPKRKSRRTVDAPLLASIAWLARRGTVPIVIIAIGIFIFSGAGATKLSHETRFLDYFAEDTLIYKGLHFIDTRLGGTTTLEVMLTAMPDAEREADNSEPVADGSSQPRPPRVEAPSISQTQPEVDMTAPGAGFFYDPDNIDRLRRLTDHLETFDAVGRVMSLASFIDIVEQWRERDPLVDAMVLQLASYPRQFIGRFLGEEIAQIAYGDESLPMTRDPDEQERRARHIVAAMLCTSLPREQLAGYVTPNFRSARVEIRMHETAKVLDRTEIIQHVRDHLAADPAYREAGWTWVINDVSEPSVEDADADTSSGAIGADDANEATAADAEPTEHTDDERLLDTRVTGIYVLYANMLKSLVTSQLSSLAWVFIGIFLMLWLLFRSLRLALLGMLPNMLPVTVVLGVMGYTGVSLDLMTIMIASVSMGIAVDGTIHYVVRFRRELHALWATGTLTRKECYQHAINRTHTSIGVGILYTSVSVIAGFAVLAMSNFLPTIRFGLLTAVAMFASLFGSLTLLPATLLLLRPIPLKGKPGDPPTVELPADVEIKTESTEPVANQP